LIVELNIFLPVRTIDNVDIFGNCHLCAVGEGGAQLDGVNIRFGQGMNRGNTPILTISGINKKEGAVLKITAEGCCRR
jgi:hypothetical protein